MAYRLDKLAQLGFPFAFGTLCYVWRDRLVLDYRIALALWVFPFVAAGSMVMPLTIIVAVGYSLLLIGFVLKGRLLAYNRLGDYSYGVYIYAFPVQQLMVHLFPGISPLENMALAAPVTVLLACISWHFIEQPALAKVTPLANRAQAWLTRGATRVSQPRH
ncbi:MAG: hypothetical protein HC870_00945 [Rhizobiales bacterium]|nr:hypothetical protein [Hyphomicrobiales bacterium]